MANTDSPPAYWVMGALPDKSEVHVNLALSVHATFSEFSWSDAIRLRAANKDITLPRDKFDSVSNYIRRFYTPWGEEGKWINPFHICSISVPKREAKALSSDQHLSSNPIRVRLHQIYETETCLIPAAQVQTLLRVAGLTQIDDTTWISLQKVIYHNSITGTCRMDSRDFQAIEPYLATVSLVVEASDWFEHVNQHSKCHWTNPAHAQIHDGEKIVYCHNVLHNFNTLTKESIERFKTLPWYTISDDMAINLGNVQTVQPREGDLCIAYMDHNIQMTLPAALGNQITEALKKFAEDKQKE